MKHRKYAIDNFYQCYFDCKFKFKHIFSPLSLANGKNSSFMLTYSNQIKHFHYPDGLKDRTKSINNIRKESI